MDVNIGLANDKRAAVGRMLNQLVASEHVLYTKTRKYHWNVEGPMFHALHEMFEEQYRALADLNDDVAERARALGVEAVGTLKEFLEHSDLKEEPGESPEAMTMVTNLAADHEALARRARDDAEKAEDDAGDPVTADFLRGLAMKHEEYAWMLRATASKRG